MSALDGLRKAEEEAARPLMSHLSACVMRRLYGDDAWDECECPIDGDLAAYREAVAARVRAEMQEEAQ